MYLQYKSIIDSNPIDCLIKVQQINYAQAWAKRNEREPDSAKIFLVSGVKPVHVLMPLKELVEITGFYLNDAWDYGSNMYQASARAINLNNITQVRPYLVSKAVAHYVIYFQGNDSLFVSLQNGEKIKQMLL